MNENEAKTLIERFAEKQQGGHFACPRCGKMTMDAESVPQRSEPQGNGLYLRCLRNAGGLGGYDGQHNSADRMGYRRRARKLAHGGRWQ